MSIEYRLPSDLHLVSATITLSQSVDWGHGLIGVPNAWKASRGQGIRIAVLDTGIALNHPDLKDQIIAHKDFTGKGSVDDGHGHGTHCAGIIAAIDNQLGVVGVAPEAKLIIGKVLADSGSGGDAGIAAGIEWAMESGAHLISMSLGSSFPSPAIHAAVKLAYKRGIHVIAAAGNEGPGEGTTGYPGGYPECISVGAIGADGRLTSFSSRGKVDVAAPGANILSCLPSGYGTMSGTSMACPYVAGAAALALASCLAASTALPTTEQFKAMIRGAAIDKGPKGKDTGFGWGIVNPTFLIGELAPPPPAKG